MTIWSVERRSLFSPYILVDRDFRSIQPVRESATSTNGGGRDGVPRGQDDTQGGLVTAVVYEVHATSRGIYFFITSYTNLRGGSGRKAAQDITWISP